MPYRSTLLMKSSTGKDDDNTQLLAGKHIDIDWYMASFVSWASISPIEALKKHFLLFALVSFFSSNLLAQNFGIGFSPEISYRNVVKTDFVEGIDEFVERSNELDESIFGYTAGAFFTKSFGRNLYFETGITYSQDGYNSVYRDYTYDFLVDQGLINSDDPGFDATTEIEIQNRFNAVGIPLNIVYISSGDKARFTWSLGITPEYLVGTSSERIYRFETGNEESFDVDFATDPPDFTLTASLSAGVELALDRTSAIRIEPIVRYGALPMFDEATYEVSLFSYGLSLKYFFDLNLP